MHANVFSHGIFAINTSWIYFNAHETMAPSRGWQWGRNVIFHTKLDFKPLFMPFEANSGSVCSNVKCKPQNFYLFYWLESFFFSYRKPKIIFCQRNEQLWIYRECFVQILPDIAYRPISFVFPLSHSTVT